MTKYQEAIKDLEKDFVYDIRENLIILCYKFDSRKIIINRQHRIIQSVYYKNHPAYISFIEMERILKLIKAMRWFK